MLSAYAPKNHGIMLCETNDINSCNIINNSLFIDNQINSLLLHDAKFFAATQNGMLSYENGSWNNFDSSNNLLNNDVINILASDGQERLIAISNTTIYVFKNGNWKTYEIPQNLATPINLATAIDANLNVWLATTEGISTQVRSDEAHAFFEASIGPNPIVSGLHP